LRGVGRCAADGLARGPELLAGALGKSGCAGVLEWRRGAAEFGARFGSTTGSAQPLAVCELAARTPAASRPSQTRRASATQHPRALRRRVAQAARGQHACQLVSRTGRFTCELSKYGAASSVRPAAHVRVDQLGWQE